MVEIQELRLKFSLWLPGSCLLVAINGTGSFTWWIQKRSVGESPVAEPVSLLGGSIGFLLVS